MYAAQLIVLFLTIDNVRHRFSSSTHFYYTIFDYIVICVTNSIMINHFLTIKTSGLMVIHSQNMKANNDIREIGVGAETVHIRGIRECDETVHIRGIG